MTKNCFVCGELKELDQFYAHKAMKDGHLNKCIPCTKEDALRHRRLNVERIRKYDLERSRLPHRKQAKKEYQICYREIFPQKITARHAVNNAVRDGRLEKKPCEVCGTTEKVEAHHENYDKPLEVRWFCCAHHNIVHHEPNLAF